MLKLSNENIYNWINLFYNNLKQQDLYAYGYYFSYGQVKEMEELNKLILKQNKSILKQLNDLKTQFTTLDNLEACGEAQTQIREIYCRLDNQCVTMTAKNKYNELTTFPCKVEEFQEVLKVLTSHKQEIQFFKKFLIEQVNELNITNIESFIDFVKDYYLDVLSKINNKPFKIK